MKKFLSNPIVALLLTVILVFTSMLVNTRVKLGSKSEALSSQFYMSESDTAAPAESLRSLCNAAEQLALLGTKYELSDADDVISAADEIRDGIRMKSTHLGIVFSSYDQLLKTLFSLESALARMDLSGAEADAYASARHDAADAKAAIDESGYNDAVRVFLKHYLRFPSQQLAAASGVSFPELFA